MARLPGEVKAEMILHGFARLASRDAAEVYTATYDEALMIETALRTAGTFTPSNTKVEGPPNRTCEQRLAALGDGS